MTGYVATTSGTASMLGVIAVTYQIQVSRIEINLLPSSTSSSLATWNVTRYSGASLSGGTAVTPIPLRDTAAASAATSRFGATVSGTASVLHTDRASNTTAVLAATYEAPFNMILSPGSAIVISAANTTGISSVMYSIYFDQLHLARSQ